MPELAVPQHMPSKHNNIPQPGAFQVYWVLTLLIVKMGHADGEFVI